MLLDEPPARSVIQGARRLVVKVGSSLVTNEGRGLDGDAVGNWCRQLAALAAQGREVVMVSSGAIAEGIKRLGWSKRPTAINELQAAAAVGQTGIAQAYENAFAPHGIRTAQILLTHDDLSNRTRYLNARSTLQTLLSKGIVPVINENDTVTTDEIKLGDNDTLGALVTNCDLPRRQASGVSTWTAAGRTVPLEVSAGLGTAPSAPVRFACRPEAVVLDLVPRG